MAPPPGIFRRLQERERGQHVGSPRSRPSGSPQRFLDQCGDSRTAIRTLKNVGDLEGHLGCVNTVNFNPNGDLIVSGSDDMTVKIWNTHTRACLTTLRGHSSNVFAANFFPHKSDRELISGGNDSDIRYFDLTTRTCRVYGHHSKKVLRLSINPVAPDTFLSCSADGTVRLFDVRIRYENTHTRTFADGDTAALQEPEYVLPQAFGGGRASRISSSGGSANTQTLVLDYRADPAERRLVPATLFSVDFHPSDGHSFIVGSMDGNVRLFDLRRVAGHSPAACVNIYRNCRIPVPSHCEVTGCVFSPDGREIVGTCLNEHVYVWDTHRNFQKEFGVDYFHERGAGRSRPRSSGSGPPRPRPRRPDGPGAPSDPARPKKKPAAPSRSGSEQEPAGAQAAAAGSSSSSSSAAPGISRTAPVAVPRSPNLRALGNPIASPPGVPAMFDGPILSPTGTGGISASRGSSRSGSPPSSPMYRRVGIRQHSGAPGSRVRHGSGTLAPGSPAAPHGAGADEDEEPGHPHAGPSHGAPSPGHHGHGPAASGSGAGGGGAGGSSGGPGGGPGEGDRRTFTVAMGDLEVDFLVQVISDPVRPHGHAHGGHDEGHHHAPSPAPAAPRARPTGGSGRQPPPSLSSSPSAHGAPALSSPPSSAPSPAHGPLGLWSPTSSPAPVSVAPPPGWRPPGAPGQPGQAGPSGAPSAVPRSLLTSLPNTPQPEPAPMSLPSSVATSPLIGPLPPPPPIEGIISSCSEADDVGDAVPPRPVLYRTGAPPPPPNPFCHEREREEAAFAFAASSPPRPSPLAPAATPPGLRAALRSPARSPASPHSPHAPQASPSQAGPSHGGARAPAGPSAGASSSSAPPGPPPPRRRVLRDDEEDEGGSGAGMSDAGAGAGTSEARSVAGAGPGEAWRGEEASPGEEEEEEEEEESELDPDDDDDEEDGLPEPTYKWQYRGHYSMSTIKGVNFFGPRGEWVVSGSDDGRVFLWEKRGARLVRVLDGHEGAVNCVVGHPHDPLLLSSGIDNVVKVWGPQGDFPTPDELAEQDQYVQDVAHRNQRHYRSDPNTDAVGSLCGQQ